jgi:hypothetical protein
MARKRKQKSLLETAFQEHWVLAFANGTLAMVVTLFILPSTSNPIFSGFARGIKRIGIVFSVLSYLIAFLDFISKIKPRAIVFSR